MWCVLYVGRGREERAEAFLKKFLPEYPDARYFHLTRCRRKKYGGRWQTVQEELLPGYVFLDAAQPEVLCRELKRVPEYRPLFADDTFVRTLEPPEEDFLGRITDGTGTIGLSGVVVSGGEKFCCLWGPLQRVNDRVKRLDLHGRTAQVEAKLLGEKHLLYLGIEIVGEGGGQLASARDGRCTETGNM